MENKPKPLLIISDGISGPSGLLWKQVPSCPDYEVSNDGQIKRYRYSPYSRLKGNPLKLHADKDGYLRVCLSVDNKEKIKYFHRLVAEAFIGPAPNGFQVNHKDGNKLNNHPNNLEYLTAQDNLRHKAQMGLCAKGERNGASKLTETQVLEMRGMAERGIPQNKIAKLFSVGTSVTHEIVTGKRWKHVGGFILVSTPRRYRGAVKKTEPLPYISLPRLSLLTKHEWRPVVGYEGLYEVHSDGYVKCVNRVLCRMRKKGDFLTQTLSNRGYYQVLLRKGEETKRPLVHALVAAAFIGPRPNGYEIDHIDCNKINNHISNLEYVPKRENLRRQHVNGLHQYGSKSHSAKLTEDEVREIRRLRVDGMLQSQLSELFSVSQANISGILSGRIWSKA